MGGELQPALSAQQGHASTFCHRQVFPNAQTSRGFHLARNSEKDEISYREKRESILQEEEKK
jgi:hypothetical protein